MPPDNRRGKLSRKKGGARPKAVVPAEVGPAWQKAAQRLEGEVAAGRFRESGKLPAEVQLSKEFGLSRHTLRRAIAALVKKGVLRNVSHVGTFVAPQKIPFTIGPQSRFSDELSTAGLQPGRRRLSCRECNPPAEVARMLGVAQRSKVIEIVQLLTANDIAIGYSMLWLPADRFARIPDLMLAAGTLRRAMAQLGVSNYRRKAVTVTSRFVEETERNWLELPNNSIVLGFEGVSVDDSGEATHAVHYRFDAERVSLVIEL